MKMFPVIMCGGSGTRLWPASRPSKPKQFIPLAGNRSLFQETVLRVAPLATDGGCLIIVAGVSHRGSIIDQLAEVGVQAHVLLEPEARDSAAAMAVAAAWTERKDPTGVNVFVASDHHITDNEAFRNAVLVASQDAIAGNLVTLGVSPTAVSTAYGYIRPTGRGLSRVDAFVEKPDEKVAQQYIQEGYLWNSGNFVASAKVLLDELLLHAPGVVAAARAALPPEGNLGVETLTDAFTRSPKISIDYALMEKTTVASVLEVDFSWSDLGAWDSIAATGEGTTGLHILEDVEGCLTRAADGMIVAAIGVRNLAIIAERDAVLVCDLSRSQDVKKVVERLKISSPQHIDFDKPQAEPLLDGMKRFEDWLRLRALPIWCSLGQDERGLFSEVLAMDGRPMSMSRRARVQARQVYVYAMAGKLGWNGPWLRSVSTGLDRLIRDYLRDDGLCRTLLAADGTPLNETAMVYDQAFLMLALAQANMAGVADDNLEQRAMTVRDTLLIGVQTNGAVVEAAGDLYQSNCHMHLLEASMAWETAGENAGWAALTDQIAALARSTFIDAEGGFLREFFGADWRPALGDPGRLVEPGHQFEWAWLMARYSRSRNDPEAADVARRLYAFGMQGISDHLGVAIDAMNDDGTIRSHRARLWPQTEWLKASLILAELAHDDERQTYLLNAAAALRALWLYLTPDGVWRDKMVADRTFVDEPAPASSLYHIMAAFDQLAATSAELRFDLGSNTALG